MTDRSRDMRGWLTTPLVTLLLAPGIAISLGILVSLSSTSPVDTGERAADDMLVLHARIFAVGWLLLWALPWWRGLRGIRIGAAVVTGLVLIAGPVRLFDWAGLFQGQVPTIDAYVVAYAVLIGIPIIGFVVSVVTGHRLVAGAFVVVALIMGLPIYALAEHHAGGDRRAPGGSAGSVCVMHSGSHDICPGG